MNEPRSDIHFSPTDQPLREDVRVLGALVGRMLAAQCGADFLAEVEAIRRQAIERRENRAPLDVLAGPLAARDPQQAEDLVRAFSTYFQVVNIAERVHRIRRRRSYQQAGSIHPQPDGLHDALASLKAQGVTGEELAERLSQIDIEPVFTAHPTESVRRLLLDKEQVMVAALVANLDGNRTPEERAADHARLTMALTSGWQTADSAPIPPTVETERDHVGYYLTHVLYPVLPRFYQTLDTAIGQTFGASWSLPTLLRFGTWVGGDMDGNPNVDAATVQSTVQAQRRTVLALYREDVQALAGMLSQTMPRVGISQAVLTALADYRQRLPAVRLPERQSDMPYRRLLLLMAARLEERGPASYAAPQEFIADLQQILDSLLAHQGEHAGALAVRRLLWRVRTFGFHLARLDIRQESRIHTEALDACDPTLATLSGAARHDRLAALAGGQQPRSPLGGHQRTGAGVVAVFAAMAAIVREQGEAALGHCIISMAHDAADVLTVLALARAGRLVDANGAVPLDVVPLFETVEDLATAPSTMATLFADPVYRAHLAARGNRQTVMLGYSDSGKDAGICASRWGLQRAQVALMATAQASGVSLGFFHGRGGSVSRGGGKTTRALEAAPSGSVAGHLRVTEQGEVIHRKYGIPALALRSLEQTTGAVLRATLRPRTGDAREPAWAAVMTLVATHSTLAYHALVRDPDFMRWFRLATPLDVIERLGLGSRPSRRLGEDAALSNLRAIPWVFAWSQSRAGVPGWYGLGSGVAAAVDAGHLATLSEMVREWPFFAALLDDVAMVLSKGDMVIAGAFSALSGELHEPFMARLNAEHALTVSWISRLTGQEGLLDHDRRLAQSIRLRNPYIDPMSVLQVDLLRRWRASDCQDEDLLRALKACVNGVAQGLQNTG